MTVNMLPIWETFGTESGGLHGLPKRSIEVEVDIPIEDHLSSHVFLYVDHPVPVRHLGDVPATHEAGAGTW